VCAICQCDDQEDVVELFCGGGHRFHRGCIECWFASREVMKYKKLCPLCSGESLQAFEGQRLRLHGIFENTPARPQADADGQGRVPVQPPSAGSFENTPRRSTADTSEARGALVAEHSGGRALRLSGVFVNVPARSAADASEAGTSSASSTGGSSSSTGLVRRLRLSGVRESASEVLNSWPTQLGRFEVVVVDLRRQVQARPVVVCRGSRFRARAASY